MKIFRKARFPENFWLWLLKRILIFLLDYGWEVSADTADWKADLTVIAVGWADIATIVMQDVRVSTWVSSIRPQVALRRLPVDAAANEVAAPNDK